MSTEVEDRNPVAVATIEKDVEHFGGRRMRALDNLAEASLLCYVHGLAYSALLFRKVAQVERSFRPVVSEGEQYDWRGWRRHCKWRKVRAETASPH